MKPKRYFAESMEEIRRQSKEHVFSIIFNTKPMSSENMGCIGAYALCWVDADTLLEAEKIAVERLFQEGWQPTKFEEHNIVSCDSDKYGQEGYSDEEINGILGNVAMAQKHGFYATYHKYLSEDEEH